jgi:hypothetical protein
MTKVVIPLLSREPMGTFTVKGAKGSYWQC